MFWFSYPLVNFVSNPQTRQSVKHTFPCWQSSAVLPNEDSSRLCRVPTEDVPNPRPFPIPCAADQAHIDLCSSLKSQQYDNNRSMRYGKEQHQSSLTENSHSSNQRKRQRRAQQARLARKCHRTNRMIKVMREASNNSCNRYSSSSQPSTTCSGSGSRRRSSRMYSSDACDVEEIELSTQLVALARQEFIRKLRTSWSSCSSISVGHVPGARRGSWFSHISQSRNSSLSTTNSGHPISVPGGWGFSRSRSVSHLEVPLQQIIDQRRKCSYEMQQKRSVISTDTDLWKHLCN